LRKTCHAAPPPVPLRVTKADEYRRANPTQAPTKVGAFFVAAKGVRKGQGTKDEAVSRDLTFSL